MVLTRPRNHRLAFYQFLFFTRNVKQSLSLQDEVNLIRFGVAVNALILSGPQTIQIAEILRGLKYRQLLHLFFRKVNEISDLSNFHSQMRPIVVEHAREGGTKFRKRRSSACHSK